ncbi:MAG: right-handed parallel beta-helix repeat-containing protein [Ruminococcaceae bacterium]|nr:right-handed parallel beta-helix repeat-containing protein [Oscillospiraceae bacterium]
MNNKPVKVQYFDTTVECPDIASAKAAVREVFKLERKPVRVVVTVPEGIYSNRDFVFTEEDCSVLTKVIWKAEGNVTITAGVTVPKEDWKEPDAEMASRFSPEVLPNIKMISLADYGMSKDIWGDEIAVGTAKTDHLYDNVPKGIDIGFFTGDKRMIKARYPNEGFNYFSVINPGDTTFARNAYGGEYRIDQETADRVKKWKDQNCAWIFAYYVFDWEDASSPVTFNTETPSLFPKYIASAAGQVSEGFGFTPKYYIYNVPEELDMMGEWYFDRERGNLYFWANDGAETADLYYKNELLITLNNTKNMEFSGFTLTGTSGDAINAKCDDMTFDRLYIKNIGGNAIVIDGWRNTISNSEIAHVGKKGVAINGGNEATLTHSGCRVTNNYIHHFGEVYITYMQGIFAYGCGHVIDHNEVCYTPHTAVGLAGSEQLFEYNYVHHAVMNTADAGAIYQGGNWTARGTVMRYNIVADIGMSAENKYYPKAFYFDDGMCGQTVYGNIVTRCKGFCFNVGGGREIVIKNNIVVNSNKGMKYDDRYREGLLHDGWAKGAVAGRGPRSAWSTLNYVPYLEEPWKSKYPLLAKYSLSEDPADFDDIDFPINPAYSVIADNVFINVNVHRDNLLGAVSDSVYVYSTVENNLEFKNETYDLACWDEEAFNIRDDSEIYKMIPTFQKIPVDQIGRKKV